jgi:hypothetical protein
MDASCDIHSIHSLRCMLLLLQLSARSKFRGEAGLNAGARKMARVGDGRHAITRFIERCMQGLGDIVFSSRTRGKYKNRSIIPLQLQTPSDWLNAERAEAHLDRGL